MDGGPVLKNFGVNINSWNKQTNLAGDLLFTKDLLFEDNNIVNEWVFVEFGAQGKVKIIRIKTLSIGFLCSREQK